MESATLYTLQRVHWQFFATLTFGGHKSTGVRFSMWCALYRELARWIEKSSHPGGHYYPQDVVWVLRQEFGEMTGRVHFHTLIANCPQYAVQERTCMSIKAQWERLGGGMARVRVYDPGQNGLGYLLDCLGPNVGASGANLYECRKFAATGDGVIVSDSLWRLPLNRLSTVPV